MLDPIKTENAPEWAAGLIKEISVTDWAAEIYDHQWNLIWVSSELRNLLGRDLDLGLGRHIMEIYQWPVWKSLITEESSIQMMDEITPYILHDTPGHERGYAEPPAIFSNEIMLQGDAPSKAHCISIRIIENGEFRGTSRIYGPGLRASVLSVVAAGDTQQFEMMARMSAPGQRRAAIMFADIEGSTALSRILPSATYFELISEATRAIDEIILRHGGLVGKHMGDGTSAFFVGVEHSSHSGAARASIVAAQEIQAAVTVIAARKASETGLPVIADCRVNVGLHWGETLYIGQIATMGRLEVTALGDEVNDTARIEGAAVGGEILASKSLIERLTPGDATHLDIEINARQYRILSEISEVGKSNRDNVNIPVTSLSEKHLVTS